MSTIPPRASAVSRLRRCASRGASHCRNSSPMPTAHSAPPACDSGPLNATASATPTTSRATAMSGCSSSSTLPGYPAADL
jgi:hypothetical protein